MGGVGAGGPARGEGETDVRCAVVLGGSFAGLLAARVLSGYADEVVIVEPDELEADPTALGSGPGTGPGAPHRAQLHAFLGMGHTQLERLFPGITDDLIAGGARLGEEDALRFYVDGQLKPPVPGLRMLGASRPFIEGEVRRRVIRLGNVRVEHAVARGLVVESGRVRAVRIAAARDTTHPSDTPGTPVAQTALKADIVVDAMGRSSRLGR